MQDVQVEFEGVWKRFKRGERAGSLRDAIPWVTRQVLRRQPQASAKPSREFYSLKDVNFQVRAGECLGIIGPNGAGKSTLLKCATRILRPNQGSIRVKGRVSALIEVGAGFHPDLTGRENIYLNGAILGMSRRQVTNCFDAIVDFSGMAKFIDTPVKRYSSGMFARLGFSVAAFMEPDVLLIDKALSVGDMNFAKVRKENQGHPRQRDDGAVYQPPPFGRANDLRSRAVAERRQRDLRRLARRDHPEVS